MGYLQGKTAIITGGGRAVLKDGSCGSIGYGIATAYAKEGCNLVLTGRTEQKLLDAKEELERLYGIKVLTFVANIRKEADCEEIVDNVVKKIEDFDGAIYVTYDTHFEDYMETNEGKNLPVVHCVRDTEGWQLNDKVKVALDKKESYTEVEKITFGSIDLPFVLAEENEMDDAEIELVGLCTDICVVSNALILKALFPEIKISVDSSCCAGVTPDKHSAALETMASCQIGIR